MKIVSKLLGWLMIISSFVILTTLILSVFYHIEHLRLVQYFLYAMSAFLISLNLKEMIDTELLEREIREKLRNSYPKNNRCKNSKNCTDNLKLALKGEI